MAQRKTSNKVASQGRAPDALALLKADHDLVQDLFAEFEKARTEKQKATVAEEICTELTIHAQIEEEIFYPAVREAIDEDDLMDEAEVEHASAKDLIAQIEQSEPGEQQFDAKVTVLGEYVKHHIKEEQSEMFPKVRKADLDLKELGAAMSARKAELEAE
jgi:hemerythrin superfamily protein